MDQQLPLVPLLARWRPDSRKSLPQQQLQNLACVPPVRLLLADLPGTDLGRVTDPPSCPNSVSRSIGQYSLFDDENDWEAGAVAWTAGAANGSFWSRLKGQQTHMWLKKQLGAHEVSLGQLGSLESELMERIWRRGEISVREVHGEFATRLAYTTVMTTMDRLYKKGLLQRRKVGKAYYYIPALTLQEYQERLTHHLFGMVLNNGANSGTVLSHFVDAVSETDEEMLDRLEQLVKAKRRALRRQE